MRPALRVLLLVLAALGVAAGPSPTPGGDLRTGEEREVLGPRAIDSEDHAALARPEVRTARVERSHVGAPGLAPVTAPAARLPVASVPPERAAPRG